MERGRERENGGGGKRGKSEGSARCHTQHGFKPGVVALVQT